MTVVLVSETYCNALHSPSADLGEVNEADEIDPDSLTTSNQTFANATASVGVPASIFEGVQNDSQRLSYSVFLLNSLFLTPETDCSDFAIASVILSVNTNISAANLSEGVLLTFQQLEQVKLSMCVRVNILPVTEFISINCHNQLSPT